MSVSVPRTHARFASPAIVDDAVECQDFRARAVGGHQNARISLGVASGRCRPASARVGRQRPQDRGRIVAQPGGDVGESTWRIARSSAELNAFGWPGRMRASPAQYRKKCDRVARIPRSTRLFDTRVTSMSTDARRPATPRRSANCKRGRTAIVSVRVDARSRAASHRCAPIGIAILPAAGFLSGGSAQVALASRTEGSYA